MAANRWFVDESALGLSQLLARNRDDVVYAGHPDVRGSESGGRMTIARRRVSVPIVTRLGNNAANKIGKAWSKIPSWVSDQAV